MDYLPVARYVITNQVAEFIAVTLLVSFVNLNTSIDIDVCQIVLILNLTLALYNLTGRQTIHSFYPLTVKVLAGCRWKV